MATRQPIQARHSSMLYIGLLILGLLPVLAVMMLVVTPEREEHQQAKDNLSNMRATARVQKTVIAQSQATATAMTQAYNTAMNYSHWPPFFYDDFSTNKNGWQTGESKSEFGTINRSISNNKYRWNVKAKKGLASRSYSDIGPVSDFYLTVEGQQISGAKRVNYSVVFRRDEDNNFYILRVDDDQRFRLSLRYNKEWTTLINWTKTSAIRSDQVNHLTVIAEGSHFLFYINNQLVAEIDDSKLPSGEVGLAIELLNADDEAVFEFDNFEVRAP